MCSTREARITLRDNQAFAEALAPTPELDLTIEALDGLDRFKARARVVAMMDERGLLAEIADNVHAVPHGDRSHAVLEPRLTDQWYVDAKTLAQPALAAVRDGRTNFVPKNWEKTYFDWLENIQPWCVSRQLWWGHRIPAWYGPELLDTPNGQRLDNSFLLLIGPKCVRRRDGRRGVESWRRAYYYPAKVIVAKR